MAIKFGDRPQSGGSFHQIWGQTPIPRRGAAIGLMSGVDSFLEGQTPGPQTPGPHSRACAGSRPRIWAA